MREGRGGEERGGKGREEGEGGEGGRESDREGRGGEGKVRGEYLQMKYTML